MSEFDRWFIHVPIVFTILLHAVAFAALVRFVSVSGPEPAMDRSAAVTTQVARASSSKIELSTKALRATDFNDRLGAN